MDTVAKAFQNRLAGVAAATAVGLGQALAGAVDAVVARAGVTIFTFRAGGAGTRTGGANDLFDQALVVW